MKNLFRITLFLLTSILLFSCNSTSKNKSSLTGWNFNDPKYGSYIKGNEFQGQKIPEGMVAIEGGTFTMGQVQDDVMFDWNTTPQQMHVRSFYMDETEITKAEYRQFVHWVRDSTVRLKLAIIADEFGLTSEDEGIGTYAFVDQENEEMTPYEQYEYDN